MFKVLEGSQGLNLCLTNEVIPSIDVGYHGWIVFFWSYYYGRVFFLLKLSVYKILKQEFLKDFLFS